LTEATLTNFTHPRGLFNVPFFFAQGIGQICGKWSWWNFKYRFVPPQFTAVRILPRDLSIPSDTPFSLEMFEPNGFLHETPLNFYVKLTPYSLFLQPKEPIILNAGYLLGHFVMGEGKFYQELNRLLNSTFEPTPTEPPSK